jgi:hypothetical protein
VTVACSGISIITLCSAFSPASCHVIILAASLLFAFLSSQKLQPHLMNSDDVQFIREAQPVRSVVEVVKLFLFPSAVPRARFHVKLHNQRRGTKKQKRERRKAVRCDEPNPMILFFILR